MKVEGEIMGCRKKAWKSYRGTSPIH